MRVINLGNKQFLICKKNAQETLGEKEDPNILFGILIVLFFIPKQIGLSVSHQIMNLKNEDRKKKKTQNNHKRKTYYNTQIFHEYHKCN